MILLYGNTIQSIFMLTYKIKVRLLMSNNDKHINPNNNKIKLKFTTLVLRNVSPMPNKTPYCTTKSCSRRWQCSMSMEEESV